MAKEKVKLVSNHGSEQSMDFDHAERLLTSMINRKNPTWKLSEPDKYDLVDGKLIKNRSVRSSKKPDRAQSGDEGKK